MNLIYDEVVTANYIVGIWQSGDRYYQLEYHVLVHAVVIAIARQLDTSLFHDRPYLMGYSIVRRYEVPPGTPWPEIKEMLPVWLMQMIL